MSETRRSGRGPNAIKATTEKRVQKTCLACGKVFLSRGPHNRRCSDCARSE